jgi:iron complex outermembrane receptor protein
VLVTSLGVFAPIFNAAKARVQGVEVEAAINPAPWLSLTGFYNYTDARYLRYATPAGVDLSATGFAYTPRVQFGGSARVDLPIPEDTGALTATTTYSWQGGTHTSNDLVPQDQIPSYYTLNARLDWRKVMQSPVDLAVFVNNPFNDTYRIFQGTYYRSLGFSTALYNEPRMWGVEARYHF